MHPDELNIDPSRTNWLNALPPLSDARVLKIGANDTLSALKKCGCAVIHCLTGEGAWLEDAGIHPVKHLEFIRERSIDICLVDDMTLIEAYAQDGDTGGFIRKVSGKLDEKGTLMVAFPNGAGQFMLKCAIEPILRDAGFRTIDWYVCEPSAGDPLTLYPYSLDPVRTKEEIRKGYNHAATLAGQVKRTIKDLILHAPVRFNPLFGTLVIASKDPAWHAGRCLKGRQVQEGHDGLGDLGDVYVKWNTKRHKYKQVGQIYAQASRDGHPVAICKSSHFPYEYSWVIRQEYDVLKLLSSRHSTFLEAGFTVPAPLFLESNGIRDFSVESAVRGVSISDMMMDEQQLFAFRNNIRKLLSFQMTIQTFLGKNLGELSLLSPEFLHNVSGKAHAHLDDAGRLEEYRSRAQHGDFTDVNILYDSGTGLWGIIDWEWTLAGYPPLFDAFHLISSLGYRQDPGTQKPLLERYFDSFIDTFFRKNWFNSHVKETLRWYCGETGVEFERAPLYFLDFLLYLCNKYRMTVNASDYEAMHREMLSYSMNHMDLFLS